MAERRREEMLKDLFLGKATSHGISLNLANTFQEPSVGHKNTKLNTFWYLLSRISREIKR